MAFTPKNFLVQVKELDAGGAEQEIQKEVKIGNMAICKFGCPAEKAFCKKGLKEGNVFVLWKCRSSFSQTQEIVGEKG